MIQIPRPYSNPYDSESPSRTDLIKKIAETVTAIAGAITAAAISTKFIADWVAEDKRKNNEREKANERYN